jgi:DNA invertase Pin-like site-specific DNA recombinase
MFGALAEFERSLIRERTQAGLAAARRAGRMGGVHQNSLTTTSRQLRAMLANPDIGVTQIAHRLGVSLATLYRFTPPREPRMLPEFETTLYHQSGQTATVPVVWTASGEE